MHRTVCYTHIHTSINTHMADTCVTLNISPFPFVPHIPLRSAFPKLITLPSHIDHFFCHVTSGRLHLLDDLLVWPYSPPKWPQFTNQRKALNGETGSSLRIPSHSAVHLHNCPATDMLNWGVVTPAAWALLQYGHVCAHTGTDNDRHIHTLGTTPKSHSN